MRDLFLRACRREAVERTPIWLMRQAGRYMPEYQQLRRQHDFSTLYRTPELAVEVTLQPIERLDVDAAILFSDILVPAEAMGLGLEFTPGPVLDRPVRNAADIDRLLEGDPEADLPFVYEAIRQLARELADRVPLIGFGAAPFTLAVYLVEGGGSRNFEHLRALIHGQPKLAHRLLEKVTRVTGEYLVAQARAGAQAIQLFDSWAGLLGTRTYDEFARPYAEAVLERLGADGGVPRIYFALDAAHLLPSIRRMPAEVIGLDWRLPLDRASESLEHRFALQGNLDPSVLLASPQVIRQEARRVLELAAAAPGHIFNLGHGVLPSTPVDHVQALVRTVQQTATLRP